MLVPGTVGSKAKGGLELPWLRPTGAARCRDQNKLLPPGEQGPGQLWVLATAAPHDRSEARHHKTELFHQMGLLSTPVDVPTH